jgi:hypothetical protein
MNWLSVAEIAKITRIPAPTARRYASLFREYLPSKKMGRMTKYGEDAVQIFEQIAQLYNDGHVTSEIEDILKRDYARTIDVDAGSPAALATQVSQADLNREMTESFTRLMDKFSSCLSIIADQKALLEGQRDDIQKLKSAVVLLSRSQKRLKLTTPEVTLEIPAEVDERCRSLEAKNKELEEMALNLSYENSDMKVKLQILESELVRLRRDRREMEKYLQDKIERIKA